VSERQTVVQTEELDLQAARWLSERCELVKFGLDRLPTLNGQLSHARGLVVRTYTKVDDNLLDHLPNLKVVGRAGVGLENVDVAACARRGIEVVYTPDANTTAVIEYVFSLIFDAIRPRLFLTETVDAKRWCELRKELRATRQLGEMTIGVIGMGRVGSGVAKAAAGFGANVLYNDLVEIPESRRSGAKPVDLDTLLTSADIVTLHVDARPGNDRLLNADLLSKVKQDALIVNTSRGRVVDADALAAFLRSNSQARALLDVHPDEPFAPSYPLLGLQNAFLSPHIAAATELANRKMSWVVEDIWRVLSGTAPLHAARMSK
jgi:phosphoglycerate dehydrogenase-like enzyme